MVLRDRPETVLQRTITVTRGMDDAYTVEIDGEPIEVRYVDTYRDGGSKMLHLVEAGIARQLWIGHRMGVAAEDQQYALDGTPLVLVEP